MSKSAWYCQENSVLDSVGGTLEPIKHWSLVINILIPKKRSADDLIDTVFK